MLDLVHILRVRYIQLLRFSRDIGWFYFILLLILLFLLALTVTTGILSNSIKHLSFYLLFTLLILLGYLHIVRKDREFIMLMFSSSYTIFFTEYLLLSIPMLFLFIYLEWYYELLAIIGGIFLIPLYKRSNFSLSIKGFNFWIPYRNYEWIAGTRKFAFLIFLLLISGFLLSYYRFIPLICMCIFLLLTSAYYEKFEPLIFIESTKLSPKKYLARKIKSHLVTYLIYSSPVLLIYLVCHLNQYLIIFSFLLLSTFTLTFLTISKYAFYSPNGESFKHKLLTNVTLLGIFPFIFLLPLVVLITLYLYSKSLKNLSGFLND